MCTRFEKCQNQIKITVKAPAWVSLDPIGEYRPGKWIYFFLGNDQAYSQDINLKTQANDESNPVIY